MTAAKRRLEDEEFVGIELPLHHGFPEAEGAVDEHDVGEAGVRVQREHDAGARAPGIHHPLHGHRQEHGQVIEPVLDAIDDRAVGEDRGQAAPDGAEDRGLPADAQEALVLTGEARLGQILGGRAGADRDGGLAPVRKAQAPVRRAHLLLEARAAAAPPRRADEAARRPPPGL